MNKFTSHPYVLLVISLIILSGCKKQETSGDEGFSFAFFTDIHVEYGKNADKGLQAAIEHVNAAKPDFVVTGGDLIADALGQTEEYSLKLYNLYKEKASAFTMPVYNTLGNHEEFGIYEKSGIGTDHPLYSDGMYEQEIGKRFYTFTEKGWRFYILDSVEDTDDREYIGYVDSIQIQWLKKELAAVDKETPLVIVTHIPLMTAVAQSRKGGLAPNGRGGVVNNSKEVLDLFAQHNLKLVLQGHHHWLEDLFVNGVHFITGGAVSAGWWTGPINGIQEGYLMINIKGEDIKWEYYDFGWEV